LPFDVKSGTFQNWEVIPAGVYLYDPLVDTLELELLGDVTVIANFIPPTPTRDIVYKVEPAGTTTSIDVNGVNMNVFPTSVNYTIGDTVSVVPQIDPLWGFNYWETDSVIMMPLNTNPTDSFYVNYHDTVVLHIYELPTIEAFISGNDSICDNEKNFAEVSVSFSGVAPFTFVYQHNGIIQNAITTTLNPYIIETKLDGVYELVSFSDAVEVGGISGQAWVTLLLSPDANFHLTDSDTLNILDATTEFIDDSEGNIVSWEWNFNDNSSYDYTELPIHTFPQISSVYTVSLVITDENSCKDTTFRNITVQDKYWIYIPNSFTPDFDQINDKFCISYNGIREETFNFTIYDRFSNVVYSTNDITELDCNNGWDGNYQETGNPLLMGTYIYEVNYKDFEGWKHQDFGTVFIIR
ncbi:MAG TPA: gliding motility-associated C-terminal domain-containing protein, partial [Flavobacteriales bacterium]|nr:gliding motility-associated C-terminal domain-containing protein [Flavobacteriales bacterium]